MIYKYNLSQRKYDEAALKALSYYWKKDKQNTNKVRMEYGNMEDETIELIEGFKNNLFDLIHEMGYNKRKLEEIRMKMNTYLTEKCGSSIWDDGFLAQIMQSIFEIEQSLKYEG